MHRIDNSRFLLYIEPKKEEKSKEPINDELTEIIKLALFEAKRGVSNYSEVNEKPKFRGVATVIEKCFCGHPKYGGIHVTDCGKWSQPYDFLLKNKMITNSLATFYLQYYRDSIPESEMKKVMKLAKYYKNKN